MIRRVIIRPATETSMFKDSSSWLSFASNSSCNWSEVWSRRKSLGNATLLTQCRQFFAAISQFIVKINSLIGSPCFSFRHFGSSKSSFQFSVDKETDRYTVLSASTINNSVYLIETNAYLKLISLINNHQNGLNDLLISIY